MAKKKRPTKSYKNTKSSVRVTAANASQRLHRLPTYRPVTSPLIQLEDRRRWSPYEFFQPPAAFVKSATTPMARQAYSVGGNSFRPYSHRPKQTKAVVGFSEPKQVAVCIRRKTRKEIIHAIGKAGGKVRKPTRNALSNQWC